MNTKILKLNIAGRPVSWINHEEGALLYCRDRVAWEADVDLARLLAVPYAPNRAEGLILENKNILGDQMEFLKGHASKRNDLLYRQN